MQNEISCEVIRDLLPPYAFGLANPASCNLVEKHLETCEHCSNALEQLRSEDTTAPLPPAKALGRVKKQIRRKRLRIALLSVVTAIAVLCTGFYFLVARDYPVPFREGDLRVRLLNEDWEPDENGTPALSQYRENHYLSTWGPIHHFNPDGSILVVYFARLMKHPKLQVKLNGPFGVPDGELQGSMLLNWSSDDGEYYTLKEKPSKVICRVYYLEDFGKLKPKKGDRVVNRITTEPGDEPPVYPPEAFLPYELSNEVLQFCTLIWEGDITPLD